MSVNNKRVPDLDQIHIPDPVMQEICRIEHRIYELEKKINESENTGKDEQNGYPFI